ncbi:MAG: HD domain-containing protein [Bacteroidia bacterium]|nr:HD domain-containing protein [Bacteroidia bacterium]
MDFQAAKVFILQKLREELPRNLTYHGLHHTLDVCQSAIEIARSENVGEEDLILLETAALYHDSGFTKTYQNHEAAGCDIAKESLRKFGYSKFQIRKICGMIMATRIPQTPTTLLEQILCDADLFYLGRKDFYHIGDTLYREFLHQGIVKNEVDWNKLQVKFLSNHNYFTPTAINMRQAKKNKHLQEVKELVKTA